LVVVGQLTAYRYEDRSDALKVCEGECIRSRNRQQHRDVWPPHIDTDRLEHSQAVLDEEESSVRLDLRFGKVDS
jgi:hypothetical protein